METVPINISFLHMDYSHQVEQCILSRMNSLSTILGRASYCDIAVEKDYPLCDAGTAFNVCLRICMSGFEIIVSGAAYESAPYEDSSTPIRNASEAAFRQLEDHMQRAAVFSN